MEFFASKRPRSHSKTSLTQTVIAFSNQPLPKRDRTLKSAPTLTQTAIALPKQP
ncbi:hypothetical protein [Brunnivagina elsteri]|uniref:hypothetical protein n=1 Tax=Brunnivagina elsteri TaxID=1247191 RepID=UPI001303FF3D|nr:hypothetical protein [Calothrix elsteri]